MKYQIYVLWPSLISVDVTGLPCPTHAHMAYDHSIQEIEYQGYDIQTGSVMQPWMSFPP